MIWLNWYLVTRNRNQGPYEPSSAIYHVFNPQTSVRTTKSAPYNL